MRERLDDRYERLPERRESDRERVLERVLVALERELVALCEREGEGERDLDTLWARATDETRPPASSFVLTGRGTEGVVGAWE